MPQRPDLIVVDDEPDFAEFVRTVASELGFAVRLAQNGAGLRTLYSDRAPDVIMLDILMPDEDGIELARWLSDNGYTGGLVLVSGYDPLYLKIGGKLSGREEPITLTKPIRLADLRTALKKAIPGGDQTGTP